MGHFGGRVLGSENLNTLTRPCGVTRDVGRVLVMFETVFLSFEASCWQSFKLFTRALVMWEAGKPFSVDSRSWTGVLLATCRMRLPLLPKPHQLPRDSAARLPESSIEPPQ